MNRKEFLTLSVNGAIGLIVTGSLLESCKKYPFPNKNFTGRVAVIGAGISGLYAAYLLKLNGCDVKVFEASSRIGGRILSDQTFADHNIEIGGETIFGTNSVFYDLLMSNQASISPGNYENYAWVAGQLLNEQQQQNHFDYSQLLQTVDSIGLYTGTDMTAEIYASNKGIPPGVISHWDGLVACSRGTSQDTVGILGIAESIRNQSSGQEQLYLRDGNLENLVIQAFQGFEIELNTPIVNVDYEKSPVKISDTTGNTYVYDKVLITAPPSTIKSQMTFVPEFSLDLKNAISGIGMRKGSVVILKYSERFWPQNMKSLFGGQIVQEYRNTLFGERTGTDYCIKAFLFGKHQTEAQILGNSLISEINLELDSIFGNGIATSSFISSYSYTWGDNPWIPGVQSFSNVGNSSSRPWQTQFTIGCTWQERLHMLKDIMEQFMAQWKQLYEQLIRFWKINEADNNSRIIAFLGE
jgi:monoamine oxidase